MTFEKALEAMKQGKEVMREFWAHNSNAVAGVDTDSNKENRLYIRHLDDPCNIKHYCNIGSLDLLANDWEICEPKIKSHKEEPTMYTDLEITFKSGETITYSKGEWDDYSYDGKSVAVKKDDAWVGLYNFDNVFCVELKSRED
jgi:hypothetical protein